MKTVGIRFKKYGKTYCFNTDDDSVKNGDLVVVYSLNEYKVVVVEDDDWEYDESHKNIICKINLELPDLKDKDVTMYTYLSYDNTKYKVLINDYFFGVEFIDEYKIAHFINDVISLNWPKNLFIETSTFKLYEEPEFERYELKIDFPHSIVAIKENIDFPFEGPHKIFDLKIDNDPKYESMLKAINTSFITEDEDFIEHPIGSFIDKVDSVLDEDTISITIFRDKHDYEYGDLVKIDYDKMLDPSYKHYEEFKQYYDKLAKKLRKEYTTVSDGLEIEHLKYAQYCYDYYESILDVLIIKVNKDAENIQPLCSFSLKCSNNQAALDWYNLEYKELDLIINE